MCLGIPGRIVEVVDRERHLAVAEVSGVRRTINVGLVGIEQLSAGDWVLIHVGFALARIDEAEALRSISALESLAEQYAQELQQLAESRIE